MDSLKRQEVEETNPESAVLAKVFKKGCNEYLNTRILNLFLEFFLTSEVSDSQSL